MRELKRACCSRGQCCHGRSAKSPDVGQLEFRMRVTPGSADYENQQVRMLNRVSGTHRILAASEPRRSCLREAAGHHAGRVFGTHKFALPEIANCVDPRSDQPRAHTLEALADSRSQGPRVGAPHRGWRRLPFDRAKHRVGSLRSAGRGPALHGGTATWVPGSSRRPSSRAACPSDPKRSPSLGIPTSIASSVPSAVFTRFVPTVRSVSSRRMKAGV